MTEKIMMIELFSGIGAQERALRQLNIPYEVTHTCDLDKDAVLSYATMRNDFEKEFNSYNFPSTEDMISELQNKNVGFDFMKDKHTITTRTPLNKLKQYYLADKLSHNLGDIGKVARLPYADMVTYSFPCTDLSVAGKGEGMQNKCNACGHSWPINFSNVKEILICPNCGKQVSSSTRSGLLGQVQRLLAVAYENNELPKYLLLENVKNLVGKKFKPQFEAWVKWLDSIGYNTYYEVLNAKHYGIPQNRERIFALSIRKDIDNGKFKFPDKIALNIRLKDILEKDIDERYYLPDDKIDKLLEAYMSRNSDPFIVASRGRNPDNPSDRTTGSPTEQRFEPNYNGTTNCLTSVQKDNYVCEPQVLRAERTEYGKAIRKKYEAGEVYEKIGNMRELSPRTDGISNTITTLLKDNYVAEPIVCEERRDEGIRFFKDECVGTLRTIDACGDKRVLEPTEEIRWRIRKLTPKECWRLMGFTDEDHDRAAKYVSASSLYKQAGNSICTCCLIAIFNALFLQDYSTSYADKLVDYNS